MFEASPSIRVWSRLCYVPLHAHELYKMCCVLNYLKLIKHFNKSNISWLFMTRTASILLSPFHLSSSYNSFKWHTKSMTRSHTSARSRFNLLLSKTAAYQNSVLPTLSRLLVDKNAELKHYLQNLSWIHISHSPSPYCTTVLASAI